MGLEVLRAGRKSDRPPLLFVHGSFCAAWIWQEHFLPYFAEAGWDCLALSLRGHGGSPGALDNAGLAEYVADVAEVVDSLDQPPIVVGHSMGGMVAQRFACAHTCAGLALMASVGPAGLGASLAHMSLFHPSLLMQLGRLQTEGPETVDYEIIRRGLFSDDFPSEAASRYVPLFQRESTRVGTELMAPQFWSLMPRPAIPVLVMGGDRDAFIPQSDLMSAAGYWNGRLCLMPDTPHVMMLDTTWERSAKVLRDWLEGL